MDGAGRSPSSGVEPPIVSPTMRNDPGGDEPRTRGFLFCDLRGYTDFVEIHGDRAAADLLERYRTIVRAAVARADGAEIRTEGDGFYIVFPSASPAVRCGLDIVAAAATASADEPGLPIRVGVGIHAGESVERPEGYVGSAVNIAARVCAEAGPAEVLVTETVRGLVRTSLDVSFVARGRPRLKGIAEPIALYRVTSGVSPAVIAHRPSTRPVGLILVGAAAVVIAGVLIARSAMESGGATPSAPIVSPSLAPAASSSAAAPASLAGSAPLSGHLAFVATQVVGSDVSPRGQLYIAEAAGGGWKRMSELTDQVLGATWSPDGRRLLYQVSSNENLPPPVVEVASAPAASRLPWPFPTDVLVWGGRDYSVGPFAWSPTGEVFVCGIGEDPGPFQMRIFAVAADGASFRLATEADPAVQPGSVDDCGPAVSPDGLTVAFASGPNIHEVAIWAAASDGAGRIQVTDDVVVSIERGITVSWSPDGLRLVFAGQARRDGPIEIWTIEAQGTELRQLTDDDVTDGSPAWSPDGRSIAWTRTVSGQRQIWVMAADGSDARPLIVAAKGEQLELMGWAPDPD